MPAEFFSQHYTEESEIPAEEAQSKYGNPVIPLCQWNALYTKLEIACIIVNVMFHRSLMHTYILQSRM